MMGEKKLKKDDKTKSKIASWELGKTKGKGTRFVRVKFFGKIEWTGWLTAKTEENTMGTLADMGFKGSNLSMLAQDGALDTEPQYEITIDSSRQYEGKTYYSARWVNKIYEAKFKPNKDIDLSEFDQDVSGYIPDAQDINPPATSESQPDYNVSTDANFASDDIPF